MPESHPISHKHQHLHSTISNSSPSHTRRHLRTNPPTTGVVQQISGHPTAVVITSNHINQHMGYIHLHPSKHLVTTSSKRTITSNSRIRLQSAKETVKIKFIPPHILKFRRHITININNSNSSSKQRPRNTTTNPNRSKTMPPKISTFPLILSRPPVRSMLVVCPAIRPHRLEKLLLGIVAAAVQTEVVLELTIRTTIPAMVFPTTVQVQVISVSKCFSEQYCCFVSPKWLMFVRFAYRLLVASFVTLVGRNAEIISRKN